MDVWSYILGKNSSGGGGGGQDFTIEDGEKWYNLIDQIDKITINTNNWEEIFSGYNGSKLPKIDYQGTITSLKNAFSQCYSLKKLNLSNTDIAYRPDVTSLFQYSRSIAVLDVSNWDFHNMPTWGTASMFSNCGTSCLQSDGAYADGIPYIYVKDEYAQNWILTQSNGHPSTWTTDNVVVKS